VTVVLDHVSRGVYPTGIELVPLPKPGKDTVRLLTDMHPLDELTLRVLIGRVAGAVAASIDRSVVFGSDLAHRPPAWHLEPHGPANKRRQARGLDLLHEPGCAGVLALDVRDYFGSITTPNLGQMMTDARAPDGAVASIARVLNYWGRFGLEGLPVGFEGSSLLASAFLAPGDEVLRQLGLRVVRWMDDTWAFPDYGHDVEAVALAYCERIGPIGLCVNHSKTVFAEGDEAEAVVRDASLASMTKGDTRSVEVDEAMVLIESAVEATEVVDWRRFRFGLGALRRHHSGAALPLLMERPELFDEEPKTVGDYLDDVVQGPDRREVDRDWLVELATKRCQPRQLARRVHACRALRSTKGGAGVDDNRLLRDSITAKSLPTAVRAWSASAWATGQGWKAKHAVELAADATASYAVRRALVDGLRRHKALNTPNAAAWKQKLLDVEPGLEPTLAWAQRST
jgi:hypothetical protein